MWSSQQPDEGGCDEEAEAAFGSIWAGSFAVTWPPPVAQREERRRFWAAIETGQTSEDAASLAGVSPAVGIRWFREAGGMPPAGFSSSAKPPLGRYLQFAEREEIVSIGFGIWVLPSFV